MSTPVNIKDSTTGTVAKVTRFGQLVVAPLQYSTPVADEVDVINTAITSAKTFPPELNRFAIE